MIRIPTPKYTYAETLDKCEEGILRKRVLLERLQNARDDLLAAARTYRAKVRNGTLHEIRVLGKVSKTTAVIGELTKPDMIKVYEGYFVNDKKPARKVYESLLLAHTECPFCAIGAPKNLDHFLPKGEFPQYAVFPYNLVPSCLDCNLGEKSDDVAQVAEAQIIHPYSDENIYFTTQWISATYHPAQAPATGRIEFFTSPPDDWSASQKNKVREHFRAFGLAKRYGTLAARQLPYSLNQLEHSRVDESYELACERILVPIIENDVLPNDWFRVMHQALLQHFAPPQAAASAS